MVYEALVQNFKDGDIIYGLDQPRKEALAALETQTRIRKTEIRIRWCGLSRQELNNILIQNDLTNAVWDPISPNRYSNDSYIKNDIVDHKRGTDFRTFLSNHNKYNVAQRGANEMDREKRGRIGWGRTSKAGLEFQMYNRASTVHFIVEQLDLSEITQKSSEITQKSGFGTSITSQEIRWLYRHRNTIQVRQKLKLYEKTGEISLDSFFSRKEWNAYHPKNEYK